jgi:hypothetical protein
LGGKSKKIRGEISDLTDIPPPMGSDIYDGKKKTGGNSIRRKRFQNSPLG